ncbi:MAG: amino acid ABC transporter permease [Chloroflexi bacterium]|nr:amino acid ABC transporter permease [Chloroflexota bacterium]
MTTQYSSTSDILPPPTERYTLLGWLHKNLFSDWFNSILSVVVGSFVIVVLVGILKWLFVTAQWAAINDNIALYMKGQYPGTEDWRLWVLLYLAALLIGSIWSLFFHRVDAIAWVLLFIPLFLAVWLFALGKPSWWNVLLADAFGIIGYLFGQRFPKKAKRPTTFLLLLYMPLVILLIRGLGEDGFLPRVGTNLWGGLLLSLLLAIIGIVFSFPIGVILALGRQSKMPALKMLSIVYIEVIRGVPLITLLFMGQLMLPFFLPAGITIDRVIRAVVAIIMFAAAYMAENVRGGLQSIPIGQYEAADAIGLNGVQKMINIILPQALRTVIPVLVGQFIGLFKDTSLVALVGLLDLLGIARGILANPSYIGRQLEVFSFIALIYWVFSYAMSYAARRLEISLGVGER